MIEFVSSVVFVVSLMSLIGGSIIDLKTREIPDVLNYGLFVIGFGIATLASLYFWDISYLVSSLLGFIFCFLFSCIMFYTGQWGGGDAKMLMALGALFGISVQEIRSLGTFSFFSFSSLSSLISSLPFLFVFLIFVFFLGGFYGLIWLLVLICRHWHSFSASYFNYFFQPAHKKQQVLLLVFGTVVFFGSLLFDVFFRFAVVLCLVLLVVLYYSYPMIRIIEEIAFVKQLHVSQVTEGDWVATDVVVAGKTIVRKKDLGISAEQLQELHTLSKKGRIKTVPIKYGIPFVPSFLLAFVVSVVFVYA